MREKLFIINKAATYLLSPFSLISGYTIMSARSKLMCGVISGLIIGLVGIAFGSFALALTEDTSSDYYADSWIGVRGKILKI